MPEDPDDPVDGALGADDPLEEEPSPPDEDDEPESLEDEAEDEAAGTVADEPERLSVR